MVVIPLSCLELSEQICVQLTMGTLNLCILVFMAVCSIYALYADGVDNLHNATQNASSTTLGPSSLSELLFRPSSSSSSSSMSSDAITSAAAVATSPAAAAVDDAPYPPHITTYAVPLADLSGFGLMLSTVVTSLLCQHSVPGLLQPLDHKFTSRSTFVCLFVCLHRFWCLLA